MTHDYPVEVSEKKGSGKIRSIRIEIAENGFTYSVNTDKMMSKEYVYETVDSVVKALKDDLGSPHLREYKKKDKGLMTEVKRGKK